MTVLAVPDTCAICNGRGQVSEGMACPACSGTGLSTVEESAKYRAVLKAAALEGAKQRYAAAGVQAAEDWLREVEQAREAAAQARQNAGQVLAALGRAQAVHASVRAVLADTQAMHAQTRALVQQAGQFAPASFPVTPPGHPTFPLTGATGDPLLIIDSILVRELDVWGALNIPGGSGGLMTNPLTTTGDLIIGNPGSTPARLGIGATNQVLTVIGGLPSWQNSAAGFANPMTTISDLIVGGPGGAATRLGTGVSAAGSLLTISGTGAVVWGTGPLTTAGDLLFFSNAGSFLQRLAIGTAGQVLTVAGGVPSWQPATGGGGFPNPMTTSGDMITATAGGTAIRLAVGSNGQVLTVAGGVPSWANPGSAVAYLFPSGDTTGTTDDSNFAAAVASLPNGGMIQLAQGAFYTKAGWVPPAQTTAAPFGSTIAGNPVSIQGSGRATILFPVGNNITAISYHRTTSYGAQYGLQAQPQTGILRDFVIDGFRSTGASVGVDWGDGWGYELDLTVQNFDTTGAIGVRQINRLFWTEKCDRIRLRLSNNTTQLYITTNLAPGGDHSSEYNMYDISMFCQANQNGVVIDGVNMGGSYMWIRGNMSSLGSSPPANLAALSIINAAGVTATDGHRWYQGGFYLKVEANQGNGLNAAWPMCMFSDGTGYVRECVGSVNGSTLAASNWNGAEFGFQGSINQDSGLLAALTNGAAVAHGLANPSGLNVVNAVSAAGTVAVFTNTGLSPTGPPVLMQGAQAGDHMLGIQVSGDSNPRWKVDVGGDVLWGTGSAVQDVDLKRTGVGGVTLGGGTNNSANVSLGISGASQSFLFIAEGAKPANPVAGGLLYVASTGALHYLSPAGTDTLIGPA